MYPACALEFSHGVFLRERGSGYNTAILVPHCALITKEEHKHLAVNFEDNKNSAKVRRVMNMESDSLRDVLVPKIKYMVMGNDTVLDIMYSAKVTVTSPDLAEVQDATLTLWFNPQSGRAILINPWSDNPFVEIPGTELLYVSKRRGHVMVGTTYQLSCRVYSTVLEQEITSTSMTIRILDMDAG